MTPGKDKGEFPDVRVLLDPGCFPHPVGRVELIETHISWVILSGELAYKIKKPVDFGFLDFSTLALRKHFCDEELALIEHNRSQNVGSLLLLDAKSGRSTVLATGLLMFSTAVHCGGEANVATA